MSDIEGKARDLLDAEIQGEDRETYYAAIAVISKLLTPLEGHVLVPVEPTEEMYAAAAERVRKNTVPWRDGTLVRDPIAHTWIAMVAARPEVSP